MIIPIAPVPKGRPRFSPDGHCFTPKRTRLFENTCKLLLNREYRKPMEGPVELHLGFFYKRDSDLDNMIKAILDSANNIVFFDDRQVVSI